MADDIWKPIISSKMALRSLTAAVEIRRGFKKLFLNMIATHPVERQFDLKKKKQMITLLSRSDSLWILLLVYSESRFAPLDIRTKSKRLRKETLGQHLTRASLARAIAISENFGGQSIVERRHTVAASRLVEAARAFDLFELGEKPDAKQIPIVGTQRLAAFMHAVGDHAYWAMLEATKQNEVPKNREMSVLKENAAPFENEGKNTRTERGERITASDQILDLLYVANIISK